MQKKNPLLRIVQTSSAAYQRSHPMSIERPIQRGNTEYTAD
jgi:hypothetical protein